jgi:peptidoglycan/LPS O-acetylase OafA/YrhL
LTTHTPASPRAAVEQPTPAEHSGPRPLWQVLAVIGGALPVAAGAGWVLVVAPIPFTTRAAVCVVVPVALAVIAVVLTHLTDRTNP